MAHAFHVVDVFTERRYTGNPLAVVVGQQTLSDDTMLAIAAETNYSETTFVSPVPERDGGHPVRIFTPAREATANRGRGGIVAITADPEVSGKSRAFAVSYFGRHLSAP